MGCHSTNRPPVGKSTYLSHLALRGKLGSETVAYVGQMPKRENELYSRWRKRAGRSMR